jgi:hypothetical protein
MAIRLHHGENDLVETHARYVIFQMAEVAVPRNLFREILWLIAQLPVSPVSDSHHSFVNVTMPLRYRIVS